MFNIGDVIRIRERFNKIEKELIYNVASQSLKLDFFKSQEIEMYKLHFRDSDVERRHHDVDYVVREVRTLRYKYPATKNKKIAFVRRHNDKNRTRRIGSFYANGRCVKTEHFENPIYGEYVSLLDGAISYSPTLRNLYSGIADSDMFNWVGAYNHEIGFAPTRILSDYFTLDPYGDWWNYVPYNKFEYETDKHKWWFSVFDEYELSSIDFYYPINANNGDDIEIIIDYRFNYFLGGGSRTVRVKWIDGAEGLTIFCLLPHIYMFAIELIMLTLGISIRRRKAIREFCHKRMLEYTKIIRDKNAIINF